MVIRAQGFSDDQAKRQHVATKSLLSINRTTKLIYHTFILFIKLFCNYNKILQTFEIWSNEDKGNSNNIQKMDIKLEDTELEWQATVEKIKTNAAIDKMNVDELNYLEEKVLNMKRMNTEKMEEDWGVETELKDNGASYVYKYID